MNRIRYWLFFCGIVSVLALDGNAPAFAQSGDAVCTREGLKSITDRFFAALEAHAPSNAPLASNARYTENGLEVAIGKGSWETAGKITFKRGLADTQECGTHTQTIIEEDGKPILYGARLKVDNEKISEIEAFVIRGAQVLGAPAILETKDQDWEVILPPEQRSSRLAMMAIADDYFSLFVKERKPSVSELPFMPPCDRWENGMQTTKGGSNMGVTMPAHNCSPKGFADMDHPARRFLVDVEAGVVVAYILYDSMWPDFHMFRIRNGHVDWIQAYFEYGKRYETIGWPIGPACK